MSYTANPSRIGAINGDVSTRAATLAQYLKVFMGEVLTSFDVTNKLLARTQTRTITSGSSAQFPNIGQTTASYHVPGSVLNGTVINGSETIVTIDDLLLTHVFLANIDEAMSHFDVRGPYATEMGGALARQMDQHIAQMLVLAARATGRVTGRPGGTVIGTNNAGLPSTPNLATNGVHLAAALFLAAAELDAKNIPEDGRFCVLRPAQYYNLVQSKEAINRDWGGQGAYSDGTVFRVAGIEIVKSNNLPITNIAGSTVAAGTADKYAGNFVNTVGVVAHGSAVGTVKLMDLAMESEYQIARQGTLMVAKYAVGHGLLRPEAAVELRNAAV
ncbi:major capsid protein [uncultured Caudovirales phage]|uniref:Major capsid protein n=1 Tax=uncultured Caudovirales phage TaxID=2100421 RepID=A0A6J5LY34_9CAUD|nr:major capsid protein [uncultured Caudovirales phage]